MSKAEEGIVLKALKRLAHKGPVDKRYGICMNTVLIGDETQMVGNLYEVMGRMAEGWPEHSGNFNYPIPSSDAKLNESDYYDTRLKGKGNRLWVRKQKLLRNSLISYMIKKLEAKQ